MLKKILVFMVCVACSGLALANDAMSARRAGIFNYYFENDFDGFMKGGDSVSGGILGVEYFTAKQISDDYRKNEVLGDQKYYKKRLLVNGTVKDIKSGMWNRPFLVLDGPEFARTQARFEKDDLDRIASLRKGSKVMLVCYGGGITIGSPMLTDCRFADEFKEEVRSEFINAIQIPTQGDHKYLGVYVNALIDVVESRLSAGTKCGQDQRECNKEIRAVNDRKGFGAEVKKRVEELKSLL